jgi:hypothetical protein
MLIDFTIKNEKLLLENFNQVPKKLSEIIEFYFQNENISHGFFSNFLAVLNKRKRIVLENIQTDNIKNFKEDSFNINFKYLKEKEINIKLKNNFKNQLENELERLKNASTYKSNKKSGLDIDYSKLKETLETSDSFDKYFNSLPTYFDHFVPPTVSKNNLLDDDMLFYIDNMKKQNIVDSELNTLQENDIHTL